MPFGIVQIKSFENIWLCENLKSIKGSWDYVKLDFFVVSPEINYTPKDWVTLTTTNFNYRYENTTTIRTKKVLPYFRDLLASFRCTNHSGPYLAIAMSCDPSNNNSTAKINNFFLF